MEYIYLIPILIAIIIGLLTLITQNISSKKIIDKPFKSNLSNQLYILSFMAPIKWFVNENKNDKKVKEIEKLIIRANKNNKLNYRTYISMQIVLLLSGLIISGIFSILAKYSTFIFKLLFNIQLNASDNGSIFKIRVVLMCLILLLISIPKIYLKKKAESNEFDFMKNLPILQLLVILMLKAKRPISEVLYILSITNTQYKKIFEMAYRMYLSNPPRAMGYISTAFEHTKFHDTAILLEEYGEYSKQDTMKVLENQLKVITESTNTTKRRSDIKGMVLSQFTLIFPFTAVIMFGAIPFVYWGITALNLNF